MTDTLTAADLKAVQQALYEADIAGREIDDLKACGLECGEEEARCQHQMSFLKAVLARYADPSNRPVSRKK